MTIQTLLEQDLDWEYLVQAASHNDILPLLYWRLNSEFEKRVPPLVLKELRAASTQIGVRNLSLTNELVRLLNLLEMHGVRSVPFKGPSLALSLYGNLALRRMGDLDILVQKPDVAAVKRLLIREGYRLVPEMSADEERAHLESEHHFHFHRQDSDIHVEIHWAVVERRLGRYADITYVWNRLTSSRLAGQPTLALPPEDLFLILCIHGHKHDWKALKWIGDIGWMIAAYRELDWDVVMRRARLLKQERAVRMGLFLARSFFGTPLPQKLRAILSSKSIGARAALIRGRLFRCEDRLPGFREWLAYVDPGNGSSSESPKTFQSRSLLHYLFAVLTPEAGDHFKPNRTEGFSSIIYERSSFQYACRALRSIRKYRVGVFKLLK